MSIVGDKNVFAIEWEVFPDFLELGLRFAGMKFRYWGNSIPIGIWEDHAYIETAIRSTEDFLHKQNIRPYIDFSSLSKEDVYRCIHESHMENEYSNEYYAIYETCLEHLLKRIALENKLTSQELPDYCKYSHFIDDVEDYRLNKFMRTDDALLGRWLSCNFDIEELGSECFYHQSTYLVRDIAKEQERLVWKYHELSVLHYEKASNQKLAMPVGYQNRVYEAVLPIGYFNKIAKEFVRQAKEELKLIQDGKLIPVVHEENWIRRAEYTP